MKSLQSALTLARLERPWWLLTGLFVCCLVGCATIYEDAQSVPEPYRAAAMRVDSIEIGMGQETVHSILGPPNTSALGGMKERWRVYEDDPLGGVEIIFLKGAVARVTFSRFKSPSFGIVKDISDEEAPPLPTGLSL